MVEVFLLKLQMSAGRVCYGASFDVHSPTSLANQTIAITLESLLLTSGRQIEERRAQWCVNFRAKLNVASIVYVARHACCHALYVRHRVHAFFTVTSLVQNHVVDRP